MESRPNSISDLIPEADILLALEPEELAGYLLEFLNARIQNSTNQVNRYDTGLSHTVAGYHRDRHEECQHAIMEAWAVLEREGLVAAKPEQQNDWYFVTRRGREFKTHTYLDTFRHARLFPKDSIHPEIAQQTYPLFIRGEYETAVFQAFKTVEVNVAKATNIDPPLYGVSLMRQAFNPQNGPLRNTTEPNAEQEALMHLFAGAIGRFKNPSSHRHVPITDPAEAVEMLQFASHLLRIVDDRRTLLQTVTPSP